MDFRVTLSLDGDDMAGFLAVHPAWRPGAQYSKRDVRLTIVDRALQVGLSTDKLTDEVDQVWTDAEWEVRFAAARALVRKVFGE